MHMKTTTAIVAAFAFSAGSALSDTVSFVSIVETNSFNSTEATDTETNGTASLTGAGITEAVQNADGTSAVSAGTPGFIFGGPALTTATASLSQEETNTTDASRDYTLNYSLTDQSAEFFTNAFEVNFAAALSAVNPVTPTLGDNPFQSQDPSVLPAPTNVTAASFEYQITVNDVLIFNARADALMNNFNPSAGLVFDAVSGFTPTATPNGSGGFTFSVEAIADSIFLGSVASGETLNVVSTLIARAYTPGFLVDSDPITVNTRSVDPVNLSSIGTLTSVPTTVVTPPTAAVPLPAAAWMLIAALGGLGAVRSRRA